MVTAIRTELEDAVMRLVLRASDLDDLQPLTDSDAMLVRDLKQAVGDVFDATADLLRAQRENEA